MPVRMDPGFDQQRTSNLGRMVEQWGLVPIAYLAQFANTDFTYGYVGTQDFTMYPILPPGSFIQVDESKNRVMEGSWRSEYERPIYFVETREGHTCCWCSMRKEEIILQPHPLSPAPIRILRHPQEAEVLGQIVGVAMKLTEWRALDASPVLSLIHILDQNPGPACVDNPRPSRLKNARVLCRRPDTEGAPSFASGGRNSITASPR